ncbi:hypothetical protein PHISP_01686 [Aspergillus sp. HF37]|nr:hypothetical protein PHISP_01686 [Aspergillus sp. HF37]
MWLHRVSRPASSIVSRPPRILRASWPSSSCRSYASNNKKAPKGPPPPPQSNGQPSSKWIRNSVGLLGTAAATFLAYTYATSTKAPVEKKPESKGQGLHKFENSLSPMYAQRKKSLECPGVYTWGANVYRVADPESNESVVKTPRRFSHFDDQVLRDLKIGEKSGAAITEKGDLVQWGKGFSESSFKPTKTLTGKNLTSLCISRDRIIALASGGKVYSLPIAKADQESGRKSREGSWVPFWSGTASISYRVLQPSLGVTEKVTAISGGLDHVLLLTNSGRVFSAAASTEQFPTFGQLGIPGLTWATRPKGPVDTCHEISTLKGSKITQIAAGDYHSLALSKDGRVFAFGDNSFGQLGIEFGLGSQFVDAPTALPLNKPYRGNIWLPKATGIAAGGANTFFTVDAQRVLGQGEDPTKVRDAGRVTADTWACGRGIWGTLGNGKWTHLQDAPTKVKALSGLFEYDERKKSVSPIRLREMSVGATHASAVMDNKPHLESTNTPSDKTEEWGYDMLLWGGNEHFQLGTGKRSNMSKPGYINASSNAEGNALQEARLQIMPGHRGKVGNRTVDMEQKVECGRYVSAIYAAK